MNPTVILHKYLFFAESKNISAQILVNETHCQTPADGRFSAELSGNI